MRSSTSPEFMRQSRRTNAVRPDTRWCGERVAGEDTRTTQRARARADARGHPRSAVRAHSGGAARLSADHELLVRAADSHVDVLHAEAARVLDVSVALAG